MTEIEKLREIIAACRRVVAFTGAGISAASGIPTYRGDDGVWHKYDPAKFANIDNFIENPKYFWQFFKEIRYPALCRAAPNQGHRALARLETQGRVTAVITQNIDGLHQMAGSRRVLELHGNTRRIVCLQCRRSYEMEAVARQLNTRVPPLCAACGGALKPDVVFFGESLPAGVLEEAGARAGACDLFLAIGSSLVVQPAASLPLVARSHGARLVIINKDPTPLDAMADMAIRADASTVLEAVV